MSTQEQVTNILHEIMHPEINRSLVELGMIKAIVTQNDTVTVTLALPFKEVPIRDELVNSIRETVAKTDSHLKVVVKLAEMNQQERAFFMAASEGGPKRAQSAKQIDHVVAVMSGKGGVGKSSVSALLAVALQRRGKQVGLLDADITGPSIPKMFGLRKPPPAGESGILPVKTRTGIKVMSINLLLQYEEQAVIWRGPLISSAIKQFWGDVLWGSLNYLIVDLPPGTSDASLTIMQSIPLSGVVLVTSPQDLAGMVVCKAAQMARKMKAPILGLIENMSYLHCPECGERIEVFGSSQAMQTATKMGVPLLGQLPLDPELAHYCDTGTIEVYSIEFFQSIADRIDAAVPTNKKTLFF
ncbi:MAG: ATP-binding protein [Spirochaetes bacterium]|nr:MAG: ATP-binding protein [Spirochaetota bacterium]